MIKPQNSSDQLTKSLFVIYLIALVWIILLKFGVYFSYMAERKINLVPFANGYYYIMETIMNVVIFIPMGIYLGILFREKTFWLTLLSFFMISLILEGMQYVFKIGTFDITDLITNTTGGIIGFLLFLILQKLISNSLQIQNFFNAIGFVCTVIIVSLLILLRLNMLPL